MSHNRIPIVCLVLLALTASAFIATQLSVGHASQTNSPLKMKVLREKAHVKKSPGQSEIAALNKTLPQEDKRQLEDSIPKHVPIRIKIKKEKEAGFKDLKNEKWAREFELEVTNTGTKPIYSLYFLVTTDITSPKGTRVMFPLYYGRDELGDIKTRAEQTDIPINPGESVSLEIHPGVLNAWDYARKKENRPFPKHLKVEFQFLSFGDGTGFIGTDGTALPRVTPEQGLSATCLPSSQTDSFGWKDAPPGSPLSNFLAFNLPAAIWPVNFFGRSELEANTSSSSLVQTCCEGSNCSSLVRSLDRTCVNCPPQTRVGTALCGDPDASCFTVDFGDFECFMPPFDVEPFSCQTVRLTACGTSPLPSPSPSPGSSPSPGQTPTPCPLALASQCHGGVPRDPCTNPDPPPLPGETPNSNPEGCPFGYQSTGLCCVPIPCPQPTPTPPPCPEGETSTFAGPPVCQWSDCFKAFPDPGATPTPTPAEYTRECIDFYWVWFVSYDGGKSWQPTGQVEYAGCFFMY